MYHNLGKTLVGGNGPWFEDLLPLILARNDSGAQITKLRMLGAI